MAQKQSAEDAVSAAMMAIENALSLSPDDGPAVPTATPAVDPEAAKPAPAEPAATKAPPMVEPVPAPPPARRPPQVEETRPLVGPTAPPANDDRAALGPIVQALQSRRPSRVPFAVAVVASAVWLALCVAYGAARFFSAATPTSTTDFLLRPEAVLIGLAALAPPLLLFGFVALSRRVQEMRLSAGSITQVALRLAEPETAAGEQIGTLAQAIRREIAAMGDGVERALARAAELETLVRSEVSTLERAYSDNERRIRSLIAEMADQRNAIAAQGDQVRIAVDGAHQGIAADLETLAERLSERVSTVGERVAASLGASSEDIAIAIDRAGATAIDRLSTQGAQIRKALAEVGDDVASRLAEGSEAFAADFARRGDEIVERVGAASRQASESIFPRAEELTARLNETYERVHDTIVVRGQTLEDALVLTGERLASTLSAKTDDARAVLDAAGSTWSEHFDARQAELRGFIDDSATALSTQIEESARRAAEAIAVQGAGTQDQLRETTQSALAQWGEVAGQASERFATIAGEAAASIAIGGESVQGALSSTIATFEEALGARGGALVADLANQSRQLDEHLNSLANLIGDGGESVVERIGAHADRLNEGFAAEIEALDAAISTRQAELDERMSEHHAHFERATTARLAEFENAAVANQTAVELALTTHANALNEVAQNGLKSFETAMTARLAEFESAAVANQTVVELALTTHANAFNDVTQNGLKSFETAMTARGEELAERLSAETKSLTTTLDDKLAAIERTIVAGGGELDGRLGKRQQESAAAFEAAAQAIDERSAGKLRDVAASLETVSQRIDEALAARGNALNESLARNSLEAAKRLSDGGREISEEIDRKTAEIERSLSARAQALSDALTLLSNQATASFTGKLEEMTSAFDGAAVHFRDEVVAPLRGLSAQFDAAVAGHGAAIQASIAQSADELVAKLAVQRDAIVARLAAAIGNLDAALAGRGEEATANLASRIEELRALMEGPGAEFVANLGANGERISNQIITVSENAANTFDLQTSNLLALLARRSEDLLAAINAGGAGSIRSLGELTGRLSGEVEASTASLRQAADAARAETAETVRELLARLTSEVERAGATLRDAVDRNAGASVAALSVASDRMRDELSLVLDRLGQASAALDRVVGGADDRLGAVGAQLAAKVEEMQRALAAMATQVTMLDRLSTATRDESATLVESVAKHADAFAEAARRLSAGEETIDQALQRRQATLQSLFEDIDAKNREFEAVTQRLSQSFAESFDRAQARAQEISGALTLAARGTASTVVGQFEMIRENSDKEREKTVEALKSAHELANAQLGELMNKTAERFRQSVAEVKQMAGEIQRELDATRHELQRGVFELPGETTEAANAMRRVVSDQIRALKELTAVVTASGADFDVAEPAAPTRAEPARAIAGSRVAEAPRDDEQRFLIPGATAVEPARPAPPARPRASQAPAGPASIAPSLAERGQSGWLSSLLAAASRDETTATATASRGGGDTLEGLSADIAKYVDAEAAAEMWDRWRSGDAAGPSRRLYTARGQQVFDDVRRRYRSDPQFQASTNRYAQEFERLLAKIGQSDRDGAQSRATLLSDAGKVYTLLAHASGRLG